MQVLRPCFHIRSLHIWSPVWLHESLSPLINLPTCSAPPPSASSSASLCSANTSTPAAVVAVPSIAERIDPLNQGLDNCPPPSPPAHRASLYRDRGDGPLSHAQREDNAYFSPVSDGKRENTVLCPRNHSDGILGRRTSANDALCTGYSTESVLCPGNDNLIAGDTITASDTISSHLYLDPREEEEVVTGGNHSSDSRSPSLVPTHYASSSPEQLDATPPASTTARLHHPPGGGGAGDAGETMATGINDKPEGMGGLICELRAVPSATRNSAGVDHAHYGDTPTSCANNAATSSPVNIPARLPPHDPTATPTAEFASTTSSPHRVTILEHAHNADRAHGVPDSLAAMATRSLPYAESTVQPPGGATSSETASTLSRCTIATSTGDISDSRATADSSIISQVRTPFVVDAKTRY